LTTLDCVERIDACALETELGSGENGRVVVIATFMRSYVGRSWDKHRAYRRRLPRSLR
jgi:hypothetical protein